MRGCPRVDSWKRCGEPGTVPGTRNDGAHVELVGYYRYDTAAELEKLNEIWELDGLFTNYLLPQQKLVSKERHGAEVIKKHDAALTPHQRAARLGRKSCPASCRNTAGHIHSSCWSRPLR